MEGAFLQSHLSEALLNFKSLASIILNQPCPHPVRLIGIDGGAGSGKTTFAARLAAELGNPPIIPTDDFNAFDDLEEYWPRFEAQILEPLFQGKDFRYQKRDWVNDMAGRGLNEWRELRFSPIVIIEGIGAARRQLEVRISFAVWIEAPGELRMQRGIDRDGHEVKDIRKIWENFMPGERRYFEKDRAWERANLRVDGTQPYGENGDFKILENS